MGKLVVVEGIDGSGKKTQSALLAGYAKDHGLSVEVFSFPRYGMSLFSKSVADYLNGSFGDLTATPPEFAALLFAGDRLEAKEELSASLQAHDLVICDRYVASNVAHQSARLASVRREAFKEWITAVEFGAYGLPMPHATVYLDVPADVAYRAILGKAQRVYTDKTHDLHEADLAYLTACHDIYAGLSGETWCGSWVPVDCVAEKAAFRPEDEISKDVLDGLRQAGIAVSSR